MRAWRCWEGGPAGEGMEVPYPPTPAELVLGISSIWLFLAYIVYNKPVNESQMCA